MKKLVLVFCSLLFPFLAKSQELNASATKGFWDDPVNHPLFALYLVSFFVFVVLILTLIAAAISLKVLHTFVEQSAKERAEKLGIPYAAPQGWWSKIWNSANALVPLEEEKNLELDHDYDGIHELDNHLPPWWKWLFYATIVFAGVYLVVYHMSYSFPLSGEEYANELAQAESQAKILRASQPAEVIDENKLEFSNDATLLAHGKIVFNSNNCATCHRPDGGGNAIGPNLTDDHWIHGGGTRNIFHTINSGVVEKGMPAWGKVMNQRDVRDVAFYVMSLQGTNPPGAKAPQGEVYKPVEKAPVVDSLKVVK